MGRSQVHESEVQPPPDYFPELSVEALRDKVSYVETKKDDLLDILATLIAAQKRVGGEVEVERPDDRVQVDAVDGDAANPLQGALNHSTPQRAGLPTDSRGNPLQPPPFPDNLRQQLQDRGGQLNNAGFVPPEVDVSVQDVEDFIRNEGDQQQQAGTGSQQQGAGGGTQQQGAGDGTQQQGTGVGTQQQGAGAGNQQQGAGGVGGLGGPPNPSPSDGATHPKTTPGDTQNQVTITAGTGGVGEEGTGQGGSFLGSRAEDQDLSAGEGFSRFLHRYDPLLKHPATAPHLGAWLASIPTTGAQAPKCGAVAGCLRRG